MRDERATNEREAANVRKGGIANVRGVREGARRQPPAAGTRNPQPLDLACGAFGGTLGELSPRARRTPDPSTITGLGRRIPDPFQTGNRKSATQGEGGAS
jgi:hypothetical protein